MMQKALFLFLLFQLLFSSGFSQDIVKAIDKEISSIKLSQLHIQPDTGYRHNPKGERIGITLDTAFFDNNKKLVLFIRNYKYKRIDSIETETKYSYYFLSNNANKVVIQYIDPTGSKMYVSYYKDHKLIIANPSLAKVEIDAEIFYLEDYQKNIQFGNANKFLQ